MKRHLAVAGLACGALSVVGACRAQESVTLYGVVDAGITYTSNQNGHSVFQNTGGNEQGTRWGLRGEEDLSGGNRAIFKLENGFNIENGALGQGGRMFGRNAWVGLSNDQWGALTMGRQYNAVQDFLAPLQVGASLSLTQYALHPFDTDDLNNSFRTNNSVKYVSPDIGGVKFNGLYGFSNHAGAFADNRSWSVSASYVKGELRLGAAYANLDHPAADATGAIASDNYVNFIKNVIRHQIWGAAGTYEMGAATVGLMYTSARFDQAAGSQRFQNFEGSVRYRVTPAVHVALGETYTLVNGSAAHATHYWQTSVGAQYFLSKRTDLYANMFYQRAANGTLASIEGIPGPSSSNTQIVTVLGVRHLF